jgi:allantoinase
LIRDFEGYGRNPPNARWPRGAKLAINFVINHEEGGERSIPDGDGVSEGALTEGGTISVGGRDLGAESMFQYGSRVGFWRLYRLFRQVELPCTIYAAAAALPRTPQICAAIREAGWDVVGHGHKWVTHAEMTLEQEREVLTRATRTIEECCGQTPLGWYTRYAPSLNTRKLLMELGYLYDSDAYDDELPYWNHEHGRPHLVIPYTLVNNDVRFPRNGMSAGAEFEEYIMGAIEMLLSEPGSRMLNIGLHNRIIGHPARAIGLKRILERVAKMPEVWVAARRDIARHWIAEHPAK